MTEITGKYEAEDSTENALEMIGSKGGEQQEIIDESDLRKYRTELPNLYDDSDLDVYEFRLLAHYKRVGRCTESTRTTAKKCRMSAAQVSGKRKSLSEKGFIQMQEVSIDETHTSYIITIVDKWEENFMKYSRRSPHEQGRSPHEQGVHHMNQRSNHIKNKPLKKVKGAAEPQPAEIALYREVVRHWPKQAQREIVVRAIQKINTRLGRMATVEDLAPFWTAWAKVSGNEWSLVWLDEWAVSGTINGKVQNANDTKPVEKQPSAELLERAERINALRAAGHAL